MAMHANEYDVLIVGAGIAGSSFAHALSRLKPLRIAILERSLVEPDRIVGEYLQPGGLNSLKKLGLGSCVEGIDAIPTRGYHVWDPATGKTIHASYPEGSEGRSFHHGRVIMNLRNAARMAPGVEMIEATVTDLIKDERSKRVIGVYAVKKDDAPIEGTAATGPAEKRPFYASLVIVADGCFSNLRTAVMGSTGAKPITVSQTIGVLLKDAELPANLACHAVIVATKGCGPAVMYQVSQRCIRILIDVKVPMPSDVKAHILTDIVPQLPASLQLAARTAINDDRLRRMPSSFLPAVQQGIRPGVILLGDSWNMRHPATGAGMTVALNDVVILSALISSVSDLKDWGKMKKVLRTWHWKRKTLSSIINVMSLVIYNIFTNYDDEDVAILRNGYMKHIEHGGEYAKLSVALLGGVRHSPFLLTVYVLDAMFYTIKSMFTHRLPVRSSRELKPVYAAPPIHEYPFLCVKAVRVLWKACIIFAPLAWSEIRWWAPTDNRRRNIVLGQLALLLIALTAGLLWMLTYGRP